MFCGGETLTRNVISGRVFTACLPLLSSVADENAINLDIQRVLPNGCPEGPWVDDFRNRSAPLKSTPEQQRLFVIDYRVSKVGRD